MTKDNIKQIVDLEVKKVAERLEDHEIVLETTPDAVELLAEQGYDPDMGARPLKRVIQQKVEDPLSDALLSGQFSDGDTVVVDAKDGEIFLHRAEHQEDPPPEVVAEA